jgi:hypothetical protein
MEHKNWSVQAEGDDCVHITINEGIDLKDMDLVLLNETRTPILKMKINSRDIVLCCHTENPIFAQIGHSVKYVLGSGNDFYKDVLKDKN